MLQETILRLSGLTEIANPLIVCNQEHRFIIAEQLREIEVNPSVIVLEPVGRNTAPAAAISALLLLEKDPDAVMLVLPSDQLIRNVPAFHNAIVEGQHAAQDGYLVCFGIVPNAPESGYGYIQQGAALNGSGTRSVHRFIEKPDVSAAKNFVAQGGYYWNSGMFIFKCQDYIDELATYCPDILTACRASLAARSQDLDFCRLGVNAFTKCPSDSIDYAVMERTDRAAVAPVDIDWNDIGSWSALWEVGNKDDHGNVVRGDVWLSDVSNSLIRAESRMVAAIGLEDLLVVETSDAVLLANRSKAQDVKKVVEYLKNNNRNEHKSHNRVFRPWGWYESIDKGDRFQVKRIGVNPGATLSLQMHYHRAEHWVVVRGTAKVTCGQEETLLSENQSTYIPLGTTHRLENPGKVLLEIIEVQSGSYFGEDDIIRFSDTYGRT
jgi:mannose-1-phosphate guanylyltransferase/mannose-6-phosphate isomerase